VTAPPDAIDDVAAALAEAEMAEATAEGAGAGGGSHEPSTQAALDDLMEVLGDDAAGAEGSWDEGATDDDEEEGVYLVDDDALGDDADWKKNVGTGWEDDDEDGDDEGAGVSWVERCKVMAAEEAAKHDCAIIDAKWTNGKLLFKVEHADPESFSVGITECEKIARALGYRLDNSAFMLDRSYKLVVSTPGAKDILTRDREFVAFKGFPICVTTSEPLKKKDGPTEFRGTLHERSGETVVVNAKGRMIKIPRDKVVEVRLVQDQVKLR